MSFAEKFDRSDGISVTSSTTSQIPQQILTLFEQGGIGALARAFEEGLWETPYLDRLMADIFSRPRKKIEALRLGMLKAVLPHLLFNLQTQARAFSIGEKHYDLGNDLFKVMLDRSMTYTCGFWPKAKDLAEAQDAKLKLVCEKLGLQAGMRVLDVGCGWGNFAEYAARKYNVSVVGLTVSKEQASYARARCSDLPVQILLQDYRRETGLFDRVVAIEMIEAVGKKNLSSFFAWAANRIPTDGRFLVQAITADTLSRTSWVSLDEFFVWIEKNIFPNGYLPNIGELTKIPASKLVVKHLEEFGSSYDLTLLAWAENFERGWARISNSYDERFKRRWQFYLYSCAALFRLGKVQLYQLLYAKS